MGDYSVYYGQQSYYGDPYSPYTVQANYSSYQTIDPNSFVTVPQYVVFPEPVPVMQEAPPSRPPINEADYAFPDPRPVADSEERPPTITSLPKDGPESADLLNRWKRVQAKPIPQAAPKPATLIACSQCKGQKEDSSLKCHQGHLLCVDCAAACYLQGEVECPSCQVPWTMLQILCAHYVICGESMPVYAAQRPKDLRSPKDSFICIGENRHIAEKLEEGKEIAFPENGHLTYNRNRAMEACPNNHFLCKPCAQRLVTTGDKKCPTCKAVLNYQDDQPACEEAD